MLCVYIYRAIDYYAPRGIMWFLECGEVTSECQLCMMYVGIW